MRIIANWFSDYNNTNSPGSRLRQRRIAPLTRMVEEVYSRVGQVNIVDIGGTDSYWKILPIKFFEEFNVSITLVNKPGVNVQKNHGIFRYIEADGCDLNIFKDRSFHIAHSNSVIEHVGDWMRMILFATEISRVSEKYFVQTPNFWFPIEPHCMTPFFHWLPKPLRVWMVQHFQLGNWGKANSVSDAVKAVESARLLDKKMFQELFPAAHIYTERLFFLPKSFIATREKSENNLT